jgi:hypothetical protein
MSPATRLPVPSVTSTSAPTSSPPLTILRALELMVLAQRDSAAQYQPTRACLRYVCRQLYMENPDGDKMYMDLIHPGSAGAQLVADRWLEVFERSRR